MYRSDGLPGDSAYDPSEYEKRQAARKQEEKE